MHAALRFLLQNARFNHVSQRFLLRLDERLRGLNDPRQAKNEAASTLGALLGADSVGYAWIEEDDEHHVVKAEWTAQVTQNRWDRSRWARRCWLSRTTPCVHAPASSRRIRRTVGTRDRRTAPHMSDRSYGYGLGQGAVLQIHVGRPSGLSRFLPL